MTAAHLNVLALLLTEKVFFIVWKCEIHIYLQPHSILSLKNPEAKLSLFVMNK